MNTKAASEPVVPMHMLSSADEAFKRLQHEILNRSVPVARSGAITVEYLVEKGFPEVVGWIENNGKYAGNVHFKVDYTNQLMTMYNDQHPWYGTTLPLTCTPVQLLKIMTGHVAAFVHKRKAAQAAAEPVDAMHERLATFAQTFAAVDARVRVQGGLVRFRLEDARFIYVVLSDDLSRRVPDMHSIDVIVSTKVRGRPFARSTDQHIFSFMLSHDQEHVLVRVDHDNHILALEQTHSIRVPAVLLKFMLAYAQSHIKNQAQAAAEPEPSLAGTGGQVWRKTVKLLKHLKRIGEFEVAGHADDNCSVTLRNQHGQIEFDVNYNVCLPANKHTGRNLLDVVAYLPEGPVLVLEAPLPDSVPAIIKVLVAYTRKQLEHRVQAAAEPSASTPLVFARLCAQTEKTPLHFNHQGAECALSGSVKHEEISLVVLTPSGSASKHLDTTVFRIQNGTVTRGFMSDFELPQNYTSTKELVLGMLKVAVGEWKHGVPKHVHGAAEPETPAAAAAAASDTKQLRDTFMRLRALLPDIHPGYTTTLVVGGVTWSIRMRGSRRGSIEISTYREHDGRPGGGAGLEVSGDKLLFTGAHTQAEVPVKLKAACLQPQALLQGILDVLPRVFGYLHGTVGSRWIGGKIAIGAAEPGQSVEQLWDELVKYTSKPKHFRIRTRSVVAESQHDAVAVGVGQLKWTWFRLNAAHEIQFGEHGKYKLPAAITASLLRDRNRLLLWMARSVDIGKIAPLNGGV